MDLVTWEDSFSVEVAEIDDQHKKLIESINKLHAAMKEGAAKEVLSEILNEMAEYTVFHFETEEKYFDEFHYLGALAHKAEHKEFVEKVVDFKKKFDDGSLSISIEVMNFLVDWLKTHITGSDHDYVECFREHGLS